MAVVGTYSAAKASKRALEDALKIVFHAPAMNPALTADQQAVALADAIVTWLASCPVVVQVKLVDVGLQTTTSPGSPTGPPTAIMELGGNLSIGP